MVLVVLCCASGKVKIGCWLGRGRARLRRGAKVAKLQSRQLPRRFSRPSQPARQAGGRRRARKDSYPILFLLQHSRLNDSLPVPSPSTHSISLSLSQLLFFSFSVFRFIHRPPAPPPPTTSTRASRCHASPSAAQSSLSRTRTQDAPALLSQLHPRNTASSPSPSS